MQAKITTRYVKDLTPNEKPYDVFDTALIGFLLRVQPTGYMCYYLAYKTPDGQGKRYRIGRADALTVRQARDLAEKHAAHVVTGIDIQAARQQERQEVQQAQLHTIGGFLEQKYIPWMLAEHKTGAATLARLQHNFGSLFDRALPDITPWIVEKWRAEQRKEGKAPSTINRDITALRGVLSKAVTWGAIENHPLTPLKPLKIDKQAKVRYLSEDEEQRLREALERRDARIKTGRERGNAWRQERGYAEMPSLNGHMYPDHITPIVLLTLNTGLRRGEAFSLRWENVNFQARILTVEGDTAKTGQNRCALGLGRAYEPIGFARTILKSPVSI